MKILAGVAAIIFFAVGAMAQTTNDLSDAEVQGRQLAQQLSEQTPATNFIQSGVLKIRDGKGKTSEIPIKCEVKVITPTKWMTIYISDVNPIQTNFVSLSVTHKKDGANQYDFWRFGMVKDDFEGFNWKDIMIPFAGSDFWLGDLGLEFFHWPEQKILKKENRRSRACNVLESTNPNPSTNSYSRVVSWIDEESGGIVHAEAYDAQNKLLKEFDPKSFKKVNGQWELQEMEIRNVQTGSRSRIKFDLDKE
jgi:hypothetical protein